ncbi:ribbon-helix-helix protein, CopG family [Roseburia hominis]
MGKVGRPKGENNKDIVFTLRMDSSMQRRLEAYCKKMNVAKSEALRQAIELLVKGEEAEKKEL